MRIDGPDHFRGAIDITDPADSRGGARILMDHRLLGGLAASGTLYQILRISRLPYLIQPLAVYPDASPKQFGFPNGLGLKTHADWLYPLSAPDMGCGFEVIDTGIDIRPDQQRTEYAKLLEAVSCAVGTKSSRRRPVSVPIRSVLENGSSAVGQPRNFALAAPNEEGNSWPATLSLLSGDDLNGLQFALGAATGHFVAIHVVTDQYVESAPSLGRIIIVVHTGSAPIRDLLNSRGYFLRLAEWSVDRGYSSAHDAADGFFALPVSSQRGQEFLGASMACRNFGFANRQLVADRVVALISDQLGGSQSQPAREIRHVDHVAFELVENGILARRGLQPTHSSRLSFVAGGPCTQAYLCATPSGADFHENLSPHGTPVLPTRIVDLEADGQGYPGIQDFGMRVISNIPCDERRRSADLETVEALVEFLEAVGWMRRAARLDPLLNYRDL